MALSAARFHWQAVPFSHLAECTTAAVAIGSNLGDRGGHVVAALVALASLPRTDLIARSRVVETEALVLPGQPRGGAYLNAAAIVRTRLSARELLGQFQAIERGRGRDRASEPGRWLPRTLDLDLLLYGDGVINEPGLIVPHPRMHERRFVLGPLAEVAADWRIPGLNRTAADLLADLGGQA